MSYANGTTHFNLPQTVGSDKRDWFDTNEAFRDVDEALHTASVDSSTALEQIAQAETDISAVDGKVDALDGRVTTIEGKQATDEENIAQNSLAISNLANKVDEVDTDLAEMIEVTEEASATASVEHTVGSYFRYNGNLWRTTVLIRVGDEIVPNVNCETTDVMTRIEALEQGGVPVESIIDDTVTSTTKTWSSSKINTQLGTKADDSKVGDLANLDTSDKSAIVNAINELYTMIGQIGGGNMKCKMFGTIEPTTTGASVDISSLGLTSAEDYMVICNGTGYSQGNTNSTIWIDTKTATSFTIKHTGNLTTNSLVSYQVITFN